MLDHQHRVSWATGTPPVCRTDTVHFLRAWLEAPLRTGAQLPSSRHLARAMATAVDPAMAGKIIELGPGTGAVTRALIERGVDPARLVLVEANPEFCDLLRARYPDAQVLSHDAYAAPRLLRRMDIGPVAAVVSGLPLLTQVPARRQRLLLECLQLGAPGAPFVQFTYAYRSPIPLRAGAVATDVSPVIWRNLWPARVWSYRLPAIPA
ncbi:MAG: class I SAM-dependent methyltransferase [Inquilinus sp.]|uniref:class I SAM-dependent methyltransferase n=1 Tax=Inquilinus sp. TaxID=1932117 RepID=UPI003F2FE0B6